MLNNLIIVLLGTMIAAIWQFGFNIVTSFFLLLLGNPTLSNEALTILLFLQSFLVGVIPTFLIMYFSKSPFKKCAYILLTSIIIFTILIEIWIGGLSSVIGLVLSLSAWVFLMGAIAGCVSANILKN